MSFFGFDTALPRDRQHDTRAPGFGPTPDAFAGLADRNEDADDALDFEDTYDGLGDNLDEDRDSFNDATFGSGPIGTDFDFAGQGMMGTGAPPKTLPQQLQQPPPIAQAQKPVQRQPIQGLPGFVRAQDSAPAPPPAKPKRTGYEGYAGTGHISNLEVDAGIWGPQVGAAQQAQSQQQLQKPSAYTAAPSRKMLSLEEVEAQIRQTKKTSPQPIDAGYAPPPPQPHGYPPLQQPTPPSVPQVRQLPPAGVPQILQRPVQPQAGLEPAVQSQQQQRQMAPPGLQYVDPSIVHARQPSLNQPQAGPIPPFHARSPSNQMPLQAGIAQHMRGPSLGQEQLPHPSQLSEEQRAALIDANAKRAKRNHKIHLLSKDNGLMTPQDKNFITRIQLQQLVTATGNVEEQDPRAQVNEDFYYHVLSRIRGGDAAHSSHSTAQNYLHQLGWWGSNRRYPRVGESHMRRMEQQVQRAVEAAKARPKNKQLVMEGSLGKIAFSNAKTPKPLLNIKRAESSEGVPPAVTRARGEPSREREKAILKDVERVYSVLIMMEDHERYMPQPTTEESSADEIEEQMNRRTEMQALNKRLWADLKVLEPIIPNSPTPHPFIAILSHPKGKKLLPRVFRQTDDQQRMTILTMIAIHLDQLDVVRLAQPQPNNAPLLKSVHDSVELFSQAVMPVLFAYVSDAQLGIVIGLLGLLIERVNIPLIALTKIGLEFLTMLISRAELVKQSGHADAADWAQWVQLYNRLFDRIEPRLPVLFPTSNANANDATADVYVWQFLAAIGIGANAEQQQRLVLGVKDRVMDTVNGAKNMPESLARPRLDNVNLFMKAIGLDVSLL